MRQMLWLLCSLITINGISQTTLDWTDATVNRQKQFIIQFDVANGNIIVPIKKRIRDSISNLNFFRKDRMRPVYKEVPVFFDTVINGTKFQLVRKVTHLEYPGGDTSKAKYLIAGRYYKPAVGSFIRLMFINVPKNEDVKASVDFVNQNQEAAANFNNVLNSYGGVFNEGVKTDTAALAKAVRKILEEEKIKQIKIDSSIRDTKIQIQSDSIKIKTNADSLTNSLIKIVDLIRDNAKIQGTSKRKLKGIEDLVKTIDSIKNGLLTLTESKNVDSLKMIELKKWVSKLDSNVSDINIDYLKMVGLTDKQAKDISDSIRKSSEKLKLGLDSLKAHNDTLQKIYQTRIAKDSTEIRALKDSLIKVYDSVYHRRTIYIQPFQVANTDLTNINLSYTKDGQVYATREIVFKNKNGFKLDFSTGFLGTGLKDENYRLFTRTGDSSIIIEDNKGKFNIGFALLAHAYFRTGSRFNFAITSGFSLNGSNQTVNYVLGVGVPLGLEERFIVSAGINFGKVKRLSNGYLPTYQTDSLSTPSAGINNYNWYKNIANTGVPLTEKWSNSYFLAITYNIGGIIGNSRKSYVLKQ